MHYLNIDNQKGTTFTFPKDIDAKKFAKEGAAGKINTSLKKIDVLLKKIPMPFVPGGGSIDVLEKFRNEVGVFRKIAPMIAAEFKAVDAEIRFICGDRYTGKDKPGLFTRKWMKKASVAAVYCAQEFDPSSFDKPLKSMEDATEKAVMERLNSTISKIAPMIKTVTNKGHPELKSAVEALKTWSENDEQQQEKCRTDFGVQLHKASRDMLVQVIAFEKFQKLVLQTGKLTEREAKAMCALKPELDPTGATSQAAWVKGLQPAQMKPMLARVIKAAQVYDAVAKKL